VRRGWGGAAAGSRSAGEVGRWRDRPPRSGAGFPRAAAQMTTLTTPCPRARAARMWRAASAASREPAGAPGGGPTESGPVEASAGRGIAVTTSGSAFCTPRESGAGSPGRVSMSIRTPRSSTSTTSAGRGTPARRYGPRLRGRGSRSAARASPAKITGCPVSPRCAGSTTGARVRSKHSTRRRTVRSETSGMSTGSRMMAAMAGLCGTAGCAGPPGRAGGRGWRGWSRWARRRRQQGPRSPHLCEVRRHGRGRPPPAVPRPLAELLPPGACE
jgi:hypothetical protein